MITFTVIGTPVSQGSKTAMVPTGRNADIESAIEWLQIALAEEQSHPEQEMPLVVNNIRELSGLITRLAAVKRWPIRRGRWLINLVESNAKKLSPWRAAVAAAAQAAYAGEPRKHAAEVALVFHFRRPLSHFGTGRNAAKLKPSAPDTHTQKPDIDKLVRAVLDAITGVVLADDAVVNELAAAKVWRDSRDEPEGVDVTIY